MQWSLYPSERWLLSVRELISNSGINFPPWRFNLRKILNTGHWRACWKVCDNQEANWRLHAIKKGKLGVMPERRLYSHLDHTKIKKLIDILFSKRGLTFVELTLCWREVVSILFKYDNIICTILENISIFTMMFPPKLFEGYEKYAQPYLWVVRYNEDLCKRSLCLSMDFYLWAIFHEATIGAWLSVVYAT